MAGAAFWGGCRGRGRGRTQVELDTPYGSTLIHTFRLVLAFRRHPELSLDLGPPDCHRNMVSRRARGLRHFLGAIRSAKTREIESRCVTFELAKIRGKFEHARRRGGNAKMLSSYDFKKYACKLFYIRVLGYVVDFGLWETVVLMASRDLSEKATGYALASLLVDPASEDDTLQLFAIVRNDLKMSALAPGVNASFEVASLALSLVANCTLSLDGFRPYVSQIAEDARILARIAVIALILSFSSGFSPYCGRLQQSGRRAL